MGSDGLDCSYRFYTLQSSYSLRSDPHFAEALNLKIGTHEECGPKITKFNRISEDFGTVSRESDTNFPIEWPFSSYLDDTLTIKLPEFRENLEQPCSYILRSGRIHVLKQRDACESEVRFTQLKTAIQVREIPYTSLYLHSICVCIPTSNESINPCGFALAII